MEKIITVHLRKEVDDSYDIVIGEDLFPDIAKDLKKLYPNSRFAIITDSIVKDLFANKLQELIGGEIFSFKAGEKSKTIETCMEIINEMSKLKYSRDSVIIALGGGVVGDLAGFIASIFNRGIPFVQIPTTILAQADASIGGKTAVDTKYGKNLVGTFRQPVKVYMDIKTIEGLDDRHFKTGLAETIKHAIIKNTELFDYLNDNFDKIMQRDPSTLIHIAENNCRIKAKIVEKDPNEKGLRRIVNYGHTVGHAIEALSLEKSEDYLTHGEAIAIGMIVEGRIANLMGYFSDEDLKKQEELIKRFGLPVKVPNYATNEEIMALASRDKKSLKGCARYVLPSKIGEIKDFDGEYASCIDDNIVIKALDGCR